LLFPGTTTGKAANVDDSCAAMRGMKDTSSDPLIGVEGSSSDAEELHYNKVPHYLRGGKACPGFVDVKVLAVSFRVVYNV